MPHSIFGPNQWGVNQVVRTDQTSAANIRNLIDQGYQYTTHIPTVTQIGEGLMPGADPLMIPGGVGSTIPWGDIIRDQITKILGFGDTDIVVATPPGPVQTPPIGGGLMTPNFGTFPTGGCGPRPKVPYISLPDGTVGCPSGYHPEKSGKGYCVRNRRMNPLNPRALARAGRRVGGFARAVKRARTLKKVCRSL